MCDTNISIARLTFDITNGRSQSQEDREEVQNPFWSNKKGNGGGRCFVMEILAWECTLVLRPWDVLLSDAKLSCTPSVLIWLMFSICSYALFIFYTWMSGQMLYSLFIPGHSKVVLGRQKLWDGGSSPSLFLFRLNIFIDACGFLKAGFFLLKKKDWQRLSLLLIMLGVGWVDLRTLKMLFGGGLTGYRALWLRVLVLRGKT